MLHINQQEATKHLERMLNQQHRIKERAQIERKQRKNNDGVKNSMRARPQQRRCQWGNGDNDSGTRNYQRLQKTRRLQMIA